MQQFPDRGLANPRVIHQRIDAAEFDQSRAGDVRERVRLRQIGGDRVHAATQVRRSFGELA